MLVETAGHVFDGDSAQPVGESSNRVGGLPITSNNAVPGVEGECQGRDQLGELDPLVAVFDEHAGLGLKRCDDASFVSVLDYPGHATDEPLPAGALVKSGSGPACPERHGLGTQVGCHVNA
jgi:hypothetical protein